MRVGLFVTCLVDLLRPAVGFSAIRLLQAAGVDPVVPRLQTCCGQPGYNAGDTAGAKVLARKLLGEFADCDYIVVPSGSCAGMIRTHYPELLRDNPTERAEAFRMAERTYELSQFLVNVLKIQDLPGAFRGTVAYHDSCSALRELGIKAEPRHLLARMNGVELREISDADTCCGFGGTFAVKFDEISARLADRKCETIGATRADAVVAADLGCLLHIEGRLRRRGDRHTKVLHIAELLAGTGDDPCK